MKICFNKREIPSLRLYEKLDNSKKTVSISRDSSVNENKSVASLELSHRFGGAFVTRALCVIVDGSYSKGKHVLLRFEEGGGV